MKIKPQYNSAWVAITFVVLLILSMLASRNPYVIDSGPSSRLSSDLIELSNAMIYTQWAIATALVVAGLAALGRKIVPAAAKKPLAVGALAVLGFLAFAFGGAQISGSGFMGS